ncbi:MAG TPA: lactate utilization protein [Casimicrobiaceae bacterium]|jgi:L-lactate dehydrogenase complex protein LldG|nr:lactate utilization protein [Casimicrobiaceae bacterium]
MTSSRDTVLGRVRQALGKTGADPAAMADAQAYLDAHARGPAPAFDADRILRFIRRAGDMESTVAHVSRRDEIPAAVAAYLDALELAPALVAPLSSQLGSQLSSQLSSRNPHRGVCWPEFADLDWAQAGLSVEARPTVGDDRLGITGVFCAIAETGTLVVLSGADTPTATTLLPDTHVAIVSANRIVDTMEDAFALIRKERGSLPRAINMISGPSRTGDIEQTIVLGAHGPFRVHILVVDA